MINFYIFTVTSLLAFGLSSGACPQNEAISPCTCKNETKEIFCGGRQTIDLKALLKKISDSAKNATEKQFKKLYIQNSAITEIGEKVTGDLKIEEITVEAANVERIHSSAFDGASVRILILFYSNNKLKANQFEPKPYNTWDLLNGLVDVEQLYIHFPKFSYLPNEALKYSLKKVKHITIDLNNANQLSLGNMSFYGLTSLHSLQLNRNKINYIPSTAFTTRLDSQTKKFSLDLRKNEINSSVFSTGWMANMINRPTEIQLQANRLTYLDKNVQDFLDKNSQNKLIMHVNPLNCSDCRNAWLAKNQKYMKQVDEAYCNGQESQNLFRQKFDHCK